MFHLFSKKKDVKMIDWKIIDSPQIIEAIKIHSESEPVFIFKHSTRCNISSLVLNKLERKWNQIEEAKRTGYFLDLIRYRNLSDEIAFTFNVKHESPQALLIDRASCVRSASHTNIHWEDFIKIS